MSEVLVRVEAPHFCASLSIGTLKGKRVCVSAAPILRWCVYKSEDALRDTFRKKGWKATIVPTS